MTRSVVFFSFGKIFPRDLHEQYPCCPYLLLMVTSLIDAVSMATQLLGKERLFGICALISPLHFAFKLETFPMTFGRQKTWDH